MADIESNIGINIDAAGALSALKNLQRQISVFHQTMAKSGAVSNAQLSNMQQNLVNGINATGQFSASIQRVKTSTESFTQALEKNKLSMGQYFRFAGSQVTGFRKVFSTEFDTIDKVARERVKTLQTQYIKLGRDASGAMQAIAVRPQVLDMKDLGTQTAIASQKAQLFNQLMKQGSTELLNFGKNTQWAGRQLMVGFTVPLGIMASAAMKEFKAIEEQVIRLERVYGDFTTTMSDTEQMTQQIKDLGTEFTKYGVAVSKTLGLAADAAAMGKTGADLVAQVAEANRLAVLGAVDQQQSLETTISLTNAFGVASDQLAGKVNFLNAVENQTVTSIQDLTEAIPKAGPVIQQLGGNVEDLTFFLTAMKEGGINASEGANALKSGLASLINPTGEAVTMLEKFGINLQGIVEANRGNVRGIVTDFAKALDTLDPTNRAQAIEQLFGKFQFSRLSTLFQNVIAEGSQASRVLQLTKSSAAELASLSERELKRVEDSPLYKFQGAVERFKASLAPIGEEFMKAVTPFVEFGTKILDGFNSWGDGAKQFAVLAVTAVGAIGPVLIMTFGLLANGIANMIKGMLFVRNGFKVVGAQSNVLTEQLNYMNSEQLEAASVAASLNQVHNNLIQTFTSEAGAVRNLAAAYGQGIAAQSAFMGGTLARGKGAAPKKMATGGIFKGPGTGTSDSIPAMVSNGEAIIPAANVKRYPGMVAGLIAGNIPGFAEGTDFAHIGPGIQAKAGDILGMSGLKLPKSIQAQLQELKRILPGAVANLKHSWGVSMTPSVNRKLAQGKGAETSAVATQFSGRDIVGRYGEAARLSGHDINDTQLQKELKAYDSAMSKKLRDLKKAGITTIVDTEAQLKALPEHERKFARSLESVDQEVTKEIGKTNKKFVALRKSAVSTIRDVRIGEGLSQKDREAILRDPQANQMLGRGYTKSDGTKGRRVWKSHQATGPGGYGTVDVPAPLTPQQKAAITRKANAEAKLRAAELEKEEAKSQARSVAAQKGWATRRANAAAAAEAAAQKQSVGQRLKGVGGKIAGGMTGGRLGGVGMAASVGLMMAAGQGGPVGEIAGAISGPLMAVSTLGPAIASMGPVIGTAVVALGALAAVGITAKVSFDNAQREAENFAQTTKGSAQAVEKLAEAMGTTTASQAMRARRAEATQALAASPEQSTMAKTYLQSETGKALMSTLGSVMTKGGQDLAAANIANQMAVAISEGAIKKVDADQIVNEIGAQLGDSTFALRAVAQLDKILGPGGEDLTKDPLGVRLRIIGQAQEATTGSAASLSNVSKSGAPISFGNKTADILATTGTMAAGGAAAGAIVGAPFGGVGALPGAAIGGTIGAIAGLGAGAAKLIDYWGKLGTETGAFASNMVISAQQSQSMLDSLQLEYEKRIATARAAGDIAKADQLSIEYSKNRKTLMEETAKSYQDAANAYKSLPSDAQTGTIASIDQQIKDRYKEGPMKAIAEKAINLVGGSQGLGGTAELTIKTAIASGGLNPQTVTTVIDLIKQGGGDVKVTAELVTQFGTANAQRIMEFANLADKPAQTVKFIADIRAKSPEDADKLMGVLDRVAKVGGQRAVSVAVSGGITDLLKLQSHLDQLDAMFANGPLTYQVVNDFIYQSTGFNLTAEQQAYYDSLGPGDQKAFITSYITAFETIDANTDEGKRRLEAWARGAGKNYDNTVSGAGSELSMDKIRQNMADKAAKDAVANAQQAALNSRKAFVPSGADTSGGGGGGTTPKEPEKPPTSFLDSIVKDMKTFVNAAQGLTENFQDSMNAIRSASASAFGGLSQQLRGVGLGEDVIQLMTGMSKEDWDQYKDQFFNFDGAGNVTGFKSDLTSIADKLRTITLGKFVDEQQKTLANLRDQSSALTKLVSLGMSYADAYKLVEDAALAAAIANAKSAEEIKKIIDLANQARQAQDVVNASKSLADTNKVTDATIAGLNAVIRFNGALTDTQTEAILASQELQTMLANFDTLSINQLKVLNEALQDAANKEALEIKIKMQTPEGMQELFNDGFSKAMEQFSAKEQEIKIKFTALKNPFQDIIDEFTNRIEDIKNRPGGLDDLEADLQRISEQETDVNEKYKKRFEALDQISKINDRIAAQQRTQLSLADALSQGDIAAAARAAQEIRAADAAQVLVDQREALQKSQELEIESLRGNMGLSRKQLEEQIRQLKIDIFNIEEQSIEPAQREIELLTRKEELETNSLTVLNKTKEEWEKIKNEVELARVGTAKYEADITRAKDLVQGVIDKWKNVPAEVTTIHKIIEKKISEAEAAAPAPAATPAPLPATTPAPAAPQNRGQYRVKSGDTLWAIAQQYYGNGNLWTKIYDANSGVIGGNPNYIRPGQVYTIPLAKGGMVPRYLANGGFPSIGTDTVPAMLTPGEFVVKKYAVENFGADKLKAINNGTYDGGSVYNYNMSVNVRSDANPDEIARTVMAQIKRVDSQRIRGNKF